MNELTITILYNNTYLRLLFISLIIFIGTFLVYLKKAKLKFQENEKKVFENLQDDNALKRYSPNAIIKLVKKINIIDIKLNPINNSFRMNIWGGIAFIISCFLGFILEGSNQLQTVAVLGLLMGGLMFTISLVIIVFWDYNN